MVKRGGDTWFFITVDYAFGRTLANDAAGFVKAAGGRVLGEVRHLLNAQDFSSFILQAQSSGAKAISLRQCWCRYNPHHYGRKGVWPRKLREAGCRPQPESQRHSGSWPEIGARASVHRGVLLGHE